MRSGAGPSRSRGGSLAGIVGGDAARAAHFTPVSPAARRNERRRGSSGDRSFGQFHGSGRGLSGKRLSREEQLQVDHNEFNDHFNRLARPLLPRQSSKRNVRAPRTLLEGLSEADAVRLAAVYMKDGVHGRTILHRTDPQSLKRYHVYHGKLWKGFVVVVGFAQLLLASVEPTAGWLSDERWSNTTTFILELVCLAIFTFDLALNLSFRFMNRKLLRDKWIVTKAVTIFLLFVGAVVAYAVPHEPRLLRCLRPLLVIERLANVRKIFGSILMSIPKIFTAALLLVFHIFIFGLFAFVLYAGIRDGECHVDAQPTYQYCSVFSKDCTDYFSRIVDSMLHLFTLITTANYPDVMMPAYDCSTWNVLFFIVFLTFGLYFLLSLVLAVTYTHFQDKTKEKVIKHLKRRVTGLTMAFNTLAGPKTMFAMTHQSAGSETPPSRNKMADLSAHAKAVAAAAAARTNMLKRGNSRGSFSFSAYMAATPEDDLVSGVIKWSLWQLLMRELRPDLSADFLSVLFDIVDSDHDGQITLSEFQHLASLCEVDVHENAALNPVQSKHRWVRALNRARHRVRRLVYASYAAFVWDFLVLCSCSLILYQSVVKWTASENEKSTLELIENCMLGVFLSELFLKTFALGWGRFWRRSVFNKVDMIAILGAAISTIIVEVILNRKHSAVITMFYFMRMLRLLRTLRNLGQFRVMITSFVDILPALMRYLMVSLAAYYVFAIIGMELFSHRFIRGKLVGTAYFNNDYWKNNFDTLHTAMVVLFELMIVNNWPINMEAAVRATSTNARWFYLAWYFVAVIVVINVLVAFLLDSFSTRKALNENKEQSMQHIWNKLFQLSCSVKGYNPKRWQVVRRQPIGDLYEAMYQSDLKEDPLFEASVRGALVYQSTRQKEALDKFDKIDSDDDDEAETQQVMQEVAKANQASEGLAATTLRRSLTSVTPKAAGARLHYSASDPHRRRVGSSERDERQRAVPSPVVGAVEYSTPGESTRSRGSAASGGAGSGTGPGMSLPRLGRRVSQHRVPSQDSHGAAGSMRDADMDSVDTGASAAQFDRRRESSLSQWAKPELLAELSTHDLMIELRKRTSGNVVLAPALDVIPQAGDEFNGIPARGGTYASSDEEGARGYASDVHTTNALRNHHTSS